MQQTSQRPRLAYVPGLDGLRALAVAAVLLYHHDPRLLPGGFLGVELFFVLSGYLITALLGFEQRAFGRIDLRAFWLRRARRLLPGLAALVLICLLVWALLLPDQLAQLRGDALAALLYLANWRLILDQRPYFASFGPPSPLLHLWSLAIEEQFYLLWPLLLAAALPRIGRRGALLIALAGVALSAMLMAALAAPEGQLTRAYYGTDTRAAGLLIGAALALVWPPRTLRALAGRRAEPWRDALGLAALGGLAVTLRAVHEFTPWLYRGGFLLVDMVAAAAIIAVARPGAKLCRAVLALPPLRWVGERSYSVYLWHWPVFVLLRPGPTLPLAGWPLLAARFACTLLLAELSYRMVEQPARAGGLERAWMATMRARGAARLALTARWVLAGTALLALTAWLGLAAVGAPPPASPVWAAALGTVTAPVQPIASLIGLPAVPTLTPTPAPAPLAVTPITGAPAPIVLTTQEPITPPLGRPAPARTRDPQLVALLVPVPPAPPPTGGSILIVGDSIVLGARQALGATMPSMELDAAVSRQIGATLDLLRARRDRAALADVVVIHLGNNGYVAPERVDELLALLAEVPRVVLVNTAVPRSWEGPNNAALADAVLRYPNVVLADWRAASSGRYELFWDDGVHLRPAGAQLFAELIAAHARP